MKRIMASNKVSLKVNNVDYSKLTGGKVLSVLNQEALENLSLLSPASEAFQKGAKVAPMLFALGNTIKSDTDMITIDISKPDNIRDVTIDQINKAVADKSPLIDGKGIEVKTAGKHNFGGQAIKTTKFIVSEVLALAKIALQGNVSIEYHAPRGGTPEQPEKGVIEAL
jgi:hypothetical protein